MSCQRFCSVAISAASCDQTYRCRSECAFDRETDYWRLILDRRTSYEGTDIVMQFLQDAFIYINHVSGFVIAVADIREQMCGHWKMSRFVDAFIERCRQVIVPTGQEHLHPRVVFHRGCQIRHGVGARP